MSAVGVLHGTGRPTPGVLYPVRPPGAGPDGIRALAERYPRILENALWVGMDYIEWCLAAHIALSCNTARQRLAGVLVTLASVLGRPAPDGVELDVTNEELASAAHITPFTAAAC